MAGAPWFLLAAGIVVFILGCVIASLNRGSNRTFISPEMTDKEIERQMAKGQGRGAGALLILCGLVMVFVSVVWRILRFFV